MKTRYRPPIFFGIFIAVALIYSLFAIYKTVGTARIVVPIMCLCSSVLAVLIVPSVEISDDSIVVSRACGLHKRTIPFCMIRQVRIGTYMGGPSVYIDVTNGKYCRIGLLLFQQHYRLAQDISSRLKQWKTMNTQQAGPAYPPQGVGSADP